jgi:O-antigen/teichoic acid export membrane protein
MSTSSRDAVPDRRGELMSRPRRFVGRHVEILSNAGILALGTALASAMGFVYWWFAARNFATAAVGYSAAAISMMNLLGHVGEVGLGALLMGEMHRFGARRLSFVTGALLVSVLASAMVALVYVAGNAYFSIELGSIIGTASGEALFVLGCVLTGLTLVLDQALVGMLKTPLQVTRNVAFAAIKLAILVVLPVLWAGSVLDEKALLGVWVGGQVLSILALALAVRRRPPLASLRPEVRPLGPLASHVLSHHALNLASLAPGLVLPFVVTVVISPTVNAAFYAAWTLINVAYLVPASLSTVVYAVGAKDPTELASKLRTSLRTSLLIGGVGVLGIALLPRFILGLFNPLYPDLAGAAFVVLGLSIPLIAIKYHYVAIQRLRGRMAAASLLVGLGCVLEIVGAVAAGSGRGLLALATGWIIGLTIEVALMLPVVLGALRSDAPTGAAASGRGTEAAG